MKKTLRILSLTMVIAMMLSVFTGCALVDNIKDILGGIIPNPNPEPTPDDNTVTVTWYHGAKELKTEKVEKGTILESWTPEIADKEFQGWFAEASLTEEFDFTKAIEEDTDIFAAFKSNAHVEDTNEYYFIGAGAGDMAASNWNHKTETLFMEKQEVEGANVYKLTIKMYAGDKFQICYTGGWDGQMGIGYMVGAEYCDGINAYDKTEYTAADKKVAQVLDADGNVVFTGSDEYNKSYDVWNIWLADGQDGVYTFTFTTYPDSMQYNTLEWELVEKIEPMSETHQMYLIGSFNNWAPDALTDEWKLAANDTKTAYTGIFTFAEAVQLKIYNTVNSDWIGYNGDNLSLEAGTYAFKYDTETNSFTYEALGYYLVGTFLDGDGVVNFAVKDGVTPKLTLVDGKYVGTLTVTDVTSNSNFSWIADQGKPGVMAVAVVYGSSLAIDEWYKDAANNDDNFYLAAGTYTVTFDLEAKTVTFTEATDPTPDPTPDPKPETPNVPTEDGKVTLYFTLKSDSEEIPSYAVPYITGGAWGWSDWCVKGAQKFTHLEGTNVWYVITDKVTASGQYKILLNADIANGHGWKNPSVVHAEIGGDGNADYTFTEGQQIINLGEHGFANINVADPANATWSIVGIKDWNLDNAFAMTKNDDGIFESEYIEVSANTEFKITNGGWMSSDGGIEITNPANAGNFKIETAGKYKVTFNPTTCEVTVVEKPHEHSYTNGKCDCGELDPDYTFEVSLKEAAELPDGTKVILKGKVIKIVTAWSTQFNNITVTISDGENEFYIYRLATKVEVGDIVTITGVIGSYNDSKQLAAGGTAEITGHEDPVVEDNQKTLSFASASNRTSFDANSQVWSANGITVTNNKASSSNDVADYTGPARFYQSSQLIVACEGMTKIVFNCNSAKYATALASSLNGFTGCTVTTNGSAVTVEFETAQNSFEIATLGAQVRMDSIDVFVG